MSRPQAFPWEDVMRLCLGLLRWSPVDFWRATPREVAAAFDGLAGGKVPEPAGRSDLRRLMEAFPDG
jgi:phage conserved hypothetical protein